MASDGKLGFGAFSFGDKDKGGGFLVSEVLVGVRREPLAADAVVLVIHQERGELLSCH